MYSATESKTAFCRTWDIIAVLPAKPSQQDLRHPNSDSWEQGCNRVQLLLSHPMAAPQAAKHQQQQEHLVATLALDRLVAALHHFV